MDFDDLLALGVVGLVAWFIWSDMTNADNSSLPDATGDSSSPGPSVGQDSTPGPVPFDSSSAAPDVSGSASVASSFDRIKAWADAIFHHEGGNLGDRNVRNNNPGNLRGSGFAGQTGVDGGGFAIFGSVDAGFQALYSDLQAKVQKYPNYSILQIMTRYLGGNPLAPAVTNQGDPFAYADDVAGQLGVSRDSTLQQVFGG